MSIREATLTERNMLYQDGQPFITFMKDLIGKQMLFLKYRRKFKQIFTIYSFIMKAKKSFMTLHLFLIIIQVF